MRHLAALVYALSIGFWCLTSGYALLASQTFAYEQFLAPELLPPLARFAQWHPWIALAVGALVALVRRPALGGPGRVATLALLTGWAAVTLALLVLPPLASLTPGVRALQIAALALAPIPWVLWAEWRAADIVSLEGPEGPRHVIADDWLACVVAGAIAAVLYGAVGAWLGQGAGASGWIAGLVLHGLLFQVVFCGLTLARGVASFFVWFPQRAALGVATGALAMLGVAVVDAVVLAGLSLTGPAERAIGAGFGVLLALAIAVRGVTQADAGDDAPLRVLRALVPRAVGRSWRWTGAWGVVLCALALGLASAAQLMDWNGILARLSVVLLWVLLFAACLRAVRPGLDLAPAALYAGSLLLLAAHVGLGGLAATAAETGAVRRAAGGTDPAQRWLQAWLEPPTRADTELFTLLQQHTNISRKLEIPPVELSLASLEGPPAAYRPHVFLFVIDSLRRDYLSPYDPAVDFSPAIAEFAAESTVFQHAFTRYGATGLSVPALWAGAPLLHKQYIRPFAPMNTLARLVAHERYAQWISMDNILDVILPPSEARDPLDAQVMVKDFRFCRTLGEVRQRLEDRARDAPPVFAYSLPQDIHVSVITREGARAVDAADYTGFSAPVASRVRRFDACFGDFIAFLREAGLYEDSVVILTSDHGDSLGEEGRVGHAYGLHPEVIRIPLIVRLPERLQQAWVADPEAAVYNTDLTPTLYRLLGHEREASVELMGRSLFRRPGEPPHRDEGGVMVASSYGAVYGALLDAATRLYIVDTVNVKEYAYELSAQGTDRKEDVDVPLRRRGQQAIRETLRSLADLHGYEPGR